MKAPSLTDAVRVEPSGEDQFQGITPAGTFTLGWIFGGQLLGQSLSAAIGAVADRPFHSFHAYYLRAGKIDRPVDYRVERVRDGTTFAVRRVIASQDGKQVLQMLASFKVPEDGADHQDTMPDVPPPDALEPGANRAAWEDSMTGFPFELRRVIPTGRPLPDGTPPTQRMWVRAAAALSDEPAIQDAALAYLADYGLLGTCMIPSGMGWNGVNGRSTSLDQAVWRFHPTDLREWHLVDLHSPGASDARGLSLGSIWRHDGTLVATTAQEGFIRLP